MSEEFERICGNCHSFYPVPFALGQDKGICLADSIFEPYLDAIVDQGDFGSCRELVREKMFSDEQEVCSLYEDVEFMDGSMDQFQERVDRLMREWERNETAEKTGYSFLEHSFSWLLEHDERLKRLRDKHSHLSAEERRMAADYEYHAASAEMIFRDAIGEMPPPAALPGEVIALAIDSDHAPALLTVGTHEYILGRCEEAERILLSLLNLAEDTEDLHIIIDKAGRFLLDRGDYSRALTLYTKAAKSYPNEQIFQAGIADCSS